MLNSIDQITRLLPQASESVLQEVWTILNTAAKNEGSFSELEKTPIRNHSAFLNGYTPESEFAGKGLRRNQIRLNGNFARISRQVLWVSTNGNIARFDSIAI